MKNKSFGTILSELRKEKGLKRDELANLLGCSAAAIGNYENDNRCPDFDTLVKIADYFNTTTDYLLGRTDAKTVDTDIRAVCDFTGLSNESAMSLHLLAAAPTTLNEEYSDILLLTSNLIKMLDTFLSDPHTIIDVYSKMDMLKDLIDESNKCYSDLTAEVATHIKANKQDFSLTEQTDFQKTIINISSRLTALDGEMSEYKTKLSDTLFSFLCTCVNQESGISYEEAKNKAFIELSKSQLATISFFYCFRNNMKENGIQLESETAEILNKVFKNPILKKSGEPDGND